jgi:hypothetical protein
MGHNYKTWRHKLEDVLRSCARQITKGDEKEPTKDNKKECWLSKSNETCNLIGIHVSDELLFHIQKEESAKEAWDTLEKIFLNLLKHE